MADYIYLLENRLSIAQQQALRVVREAARAKGMNVFLAGGAVRDLTSGSPVRDLDVSVQGNALKLKKDLEKAGGILTGEHEPAQALFFKFPGGVRLEVSSTRTESYPKPGKPVYAPADLKQDLYRRDFTANAMALSLNDGSYGLLIDPMNGVADIESRLLRLMSNYGFIEDPTRLIRAARLRARLGWQMDEKTQARYQTGKEENYIATIGAFSKGYELEEIVHDEDPLKVLKALEEEGWMKHLFPGWGASKTNATGLQELHDVLMQLQMQGVNPDASAASFHLLTAKLADKDVKALKKAFPRQGFVKEIESLDHDAKEFAKLLMAKEANTPSASWKLLTSHPAEPVLWLAYTSKSAPVQAKFKSFFTVWPEARQKFPYLMMQEMRIVPELAGYQDLLRTLFFELMDGKLQTPEEMKAFLEPYSPPAPPPPVHIRRPRAVKKAEPKPSRKKAAKVEEVTAVEGMPGAAAPAADAAAKPVLAKAAKAAKVAKPAAVKVEAAKALPVAKAVAVKSAPVKAAAAPEAAKKAVPAKSAAKSAPQKLGKAAPVKKSVPAKKSAPVKAAAKAAKPVAAKKGAVKKVAASKPAVKALPKKAVAKKTVAKKPAAKPVKKAPAKAVVKSAAKKYVKAGSKPAVKTGAKPSGKSTAKPALKKSSKSAAKTVPAKKKR